MNRLPGLSLPTKMHLLWGDQSYIEFMTALMNSVSGFWLPMTETSGVILDNAAYTAPLGPQLLANNDFTSWSGGNPVNWSVTETPPNSEVRQAVTGDLNRAVLVSDGTNVFAQQSNLAVVGHTYRVEVKVDDLTGGNILAYAANTDARALDISAPGTHTANLIADSGTAIGFKRKSGTTPTGTLDYMNAYLQGQRDGFVSGTTTPGQTGKLGVNHAVDLDGATSLIAVNDSSGGLVFSSFEYAVLCRIDSFGESNFGAFGMWATGQGVSRPEMRFSGGGTPTLRFWVANTVPTAFLAEVANANIPLSTWTWWFFSFNNDGDRTPRIYRGLNGAVSDLTLSPAALTGTFNAALASHPFHIGNRPALDITFDGQIDECFLINRALTASERLRLVQLTGV